MKNMTDKTPATAESFWAAIQVITEKQAETDRQLVETARLIAKNACKTEAIDRQMAETARQMAETGLQMAETARQMAETFRRMAETDRQITRWEHEVDEESPYQGFFSDEYFFKAIRKVETAFFGEKYDKWIKTAIIEEDNKLKSEKDLILINGKSVAIIEIKYNAHDKHIDQMFKKAKLFRGRFPEYQNRNIYLGLSSLIFDECIEDRCRENGIAIIKQVGDTVVINDYNLKTY